MFKLSTIAVACLLLVGCSAAPKTASSEHPIHRLKEVTDQAEVVKLAEGIIPGANPLPGDVGLVALQADNLVGVVIAPAEWAKPLPKPGSSDYATFLMSLPADQKRFREPLLAKLREAASARSGHAPTQASLFGPFILKVGGHDFPGQRVDSLSPSNTKALEYWLELPQKDGRLVQIVMAGLPGFGAYFPDQRMIKFLDQLPVQDGQGAAAPATPATP